jgi:dihydroflavonol-4-reductase
MSDADLVVVTGVSGFIAAHCAHQLLENGYRVRGTGRSSKRQAEVEEALSKVTSTDKLEFAEADLLKDEGWTEAVEGARYVLHVASPFPPAPPKDPMDLVVPAKEGALRVLRAASAAGVERTVMTSSIAAVASGKKRSVDQIQNEDDWSDLDGKIGAYERSKTIAERSAWQLMDELNESGSKMELVCVNPGMVFGPMLTSSGSTSLEVIGKLLRREVPGLPKLYLSCVDVRDVARMHLAAMTSPEAAGKRFIVAGENMPMAEIARILSKVLEGRGYKIAMRTLPNFLVRLVAIFDKAVRLIVNDLGNPMCVSSERAREVLGYDPMPLEQSVLDTAESLIEHGLA